MTLAEGLGPLGPVERGEAGITLWRGVDFGPLDPVGQRQRGGIDFRPAENHDVRRVRQFQRLFQRSGAFGPVGLPAGIAGDDDVAAARQDSRQRFERLAPHHQRLAHRQRFDAAEIGGDVPGHAPVLADHAIVGDRDDEEHL